MMMVRFRGCRQNGGVRRTRVLSLVSEALYLGATEVDPYLTRRRSVLLGSVSWPSITLFAGSARPLAVINP